MACLVASLPLSTVNHLNKQMASKPKPYVMEIPVGKSSKKKAANLQEAFEKFRKGRQREMKMAKVMEERALAKRQDDVRMEMLRTKFLEGVKKYFGVPYAKRYHDEVSPYHNAPLFLDCCGLIRRVLLGLKEDFGFTVGGGNQSYMFDTLPMDIKQDEMKPGDLVFISATYYNIPGKKWKQQRHDMVHVEVWAGDDEKTIGARWQKGIVQVFDSYKFVSKSYHSMKFHFKSIDTWLMGICKSFCPEHPWRSSKYDPGKKSIFSEKDQEEEECQAAEEQEDDDQQQNCNMKQSILSCHSPDSRDEETCEPGANTEAEKHVSCLPSIDVEDRVQNITLIQACAEDESLSHDEKVYSDDSETIKLQDAENVPQQTHNECNQNSESKTTFESEDFNRATKTNNYCIDPETTCCICPECSPSYRNCIHTRTAQDSEETSADLTTSKDRTTSLECFEVIASLECREQVEQAIISCPVEKAEQHGMIGRNSNDEKPRRQDSKVLPSSNGNGNKKNKDSPPKPVRDSCRSRMRYMGRQPAFYVSPGNGSSMVEATLVTLGWRKLDDRYDDSFKLKWVECKSQIDYKTFREGDQLVNHISNIGLLTTKLGLLCSLEEYERVLDKVGSRLRIQLSEFVPETLKLTNMTEKQKFVNEIYKEGEVWICKPVGQNQGKGIYMINSSAQLRDKLHLNVDANAAGNGRRSTHIRPPQGRIIQRYITNPLLLNGLKFDVRAYMFIASTNPYVVLYHPGYIRVSCVPYSPYSEEADILTAHLTNQYIQKKHPLYSSMKDETVWSYERIQSYIDEHHTKDKQLAENWIFTTFTKRMQQIMLTCFHSVRKKLHRKVGFFDLLGFDFMVDDNFKVWLIEVNVNPSLNTNCQVLKEVIPDMVDSTVKIALEIFEKVKKRRPVFPLESPGGFTVLYNGEGKS